MKDEVRVKLDPDTLKLLQEVDSGGFQRVDKALQGYKSSPPLWQDAVRDAAKGLGLSRLRVNTDPASFNLLLALAAKRMALGKVKNIARIDVSTAFLRAEMSEEVSVKSDPATLQLIEEKFPESSTN